MALLAMPARRPRANLLRGQLLTVKVLHDQLVVAFSRSLDEFRASLFNRVAHAGRDLGDRGGLADVRLQRDHIDHALELRTLTDRQEDRHNRAAEGLAQ